MRFLGLFLQRMDEYDTTREYHKNGYNGLHHHVVITCGKTPKRVHFIKFLMLLSCLHVLCNCSHAVSGLKHTTRRVGCSKTTRDGTFICIAAIRTPLGYRVLIRTLAYGRRVRKKACLPQLDSFSLQEVLTRRSLVGTADPNTCFCSLDL